MTGKQRAFAEEYVIDHNATQAAIRAGYAERSARQMANKLLTKHDIKKYVEKLEGEQRESRKMKADELLELFASFARGEIDEEVIVVEGTRGNTKAVKKTKKIQPKDRLSAMKELKSILGVGDSETGDSVNVTIVNQLPECDDD